MKAWFTELCLGKFLLRDKRARKYWSDQVRLTILSVSILCCGPSFQVARAEPTVIGYELVSSVRTGRTTFDYTYRLRVAGDDDSFADVLLTAKSASRATEILDDEVRLLIVGANEVVRSDDTFTIRQNRLVPFVPTAISWTASGVRIEQDTNPVTLSSVDIVEFTGRTAHEGLFPIQGEPIVGDPAYMMLVDIAGAVASPSFALVASDGAVVSSPQFAPYLETEFSRTDFLSSFSLPSIPFSLRVSGTDKLGRLFSVLSSRQFVPSLVGVRFDSRKQIVVPGNNVAIGLTLTNRSTANSLQLKLEANPAVEVSPKALMVPVSPGETKNVLFGVNVPNSSRSGDAIEIRALVLDPGDPSVRNKASTFLRIR